MNIYWLNPPLSTRAFYCDLGWMNFSTILPNHNWITPIVNWEKFKTVDDVIGDIEKQPVDILMISNYTWNHLLCSKVASAIKQKYPNVIIISGGPNQFTVPDYVDYMCYVMGHGEVFLIELFKQLEKHGKVIVPDFIPYLITKNYKSSITKGKYEFPIQSSIEEKIDYIHYVIAEGNLYNKPVNLVYETTRGCPYSCTYCEWGGGVGTKISQKPLDAILNEIELIALSKVQFIEIIDANFGILKRDVEVIKKIAECKTLYGYPDKVLLYGLTKNSKQNKETILDLMFEHDLIDHYFMAIQSTHTEVLDNVKRTDIELEENLQLAEKYKRLYGSSAKVEMIMGMPGDTLDNFYNEMNLFQRIGSWECPRNILSLLPNTEAYSEEYRTKFKIQTALVGTMENEEQINSFFSNSIINDFRSSQEIVVETYSFTKENFKEMFFMNRAQKIIGPKLTRLASIEMREWFNHIKTEEWYKPIDLFLDKLVSGQLHDKDALVIDGKLIEDIVERNYNVEYVVC